MNNYQKELIQVAAVALAMVQDDIQGTTDLTGYGKNILNALFESTANERYQQELKWGPQHHSKEKWLAILVEEVGEVAKEILENP